MKGKGITSPGIDRLIEQPNPSTEANMDDKQAFGIEHLLYARHKVSVLYSPTLTIFSTLKGKCYYLILQKRERGSGEEITFLTHTVSGRTDI